MNNSSIVTVFYSTFLGRNPSSSEISSYTSRMGNSLNSNLEMLFLNFANSEEFINYCTSRGIIPGAGDGASVISDADVIEFFDNAVLIGNSVSVDSISTSMLTEEDSWAMFSYVPEALIRFLTICHPDLLISLCLTEHL